MVPTCKPSATTGKTKLRPWGTKAHNSEPPAKRKRLVTTTAMLTRTIHQQATLQPHQTGSMMVSMAQQLKKLVKNNRMPSSSSTTVGASTSCPPRLSVHLTGAKHPSFPSPSPGMGQPTNSVVGPLGPIPTLGFF